MKRNQKDFLAVAEMTRFSNFGMGLLRKSSKNENAPRILIKLFTVPVCGRVLSHDSTDTFFTILCHFYIYKFILKPYKIIPGADFLKISFFS